jgi:hypothetical protein
MLTKTKIALTLDTASTALASSDWNDRGDM